MPTAQMLFNFPHGVACAAATLGRRTSLDLHGRRASLHLPQEGSREVGFEGALQPPAVAGVEWLMRVNEHSEDERIDWGSFFRGGPNEEDWVARVRHGVLRLAIAVSSSDAVLEAAEHVHENLETWYQRFRDWVEVLTEQDLGYEQPPKLIKAHTATETPAWTYRVGRRDEYLYFNPMIQGTRSGGAPVTPGIWRRAVREANQGRRPADALLMLRDARGALVREAPRRAVLDAATAAELSLMPALRNHLERHLGTATATEVHNGLGTRMDTRLAILRAAGLPVPKNLRPDLLDLRNRVIHAGLTPTADQARAAVKAASQVVRDHSPVTAATP